MQKFDFEMSLIWLNDNSNGEEDNGDVVTKKKESNYIGVK